MQNQALLTNFDMIVAGKPGINGIGQIAEILLQFLGEGMPVNRVVNDFAVAR